MVRQQSEIVSGVCWAALAFSAPLRPLHGALHMGHLAALTSKYEGPMASLATRTGVKVTFVAEFTLDCLRL